MSDYPDDIVREAERLLPDTAFYMHIDRALATSIARNAIAAGMMAERERCANIVKDRGYNSTAALIMEGPSA